MTRFPVSLVLIPRNEHRVALLALTLVAWTHGTAPTGSYCGALGGGIATVRIQIVDASHFDLTASAMGKPIVCSGEVFEWQPQTGVLTMPSIKAHDGCLHRQIFLMTGQDPTPLLNRTTLNATYNSSANSIQLVVATLSGTLTTSACNRTQGASLPQWPMFQQTTPPPLRPTCCFFYDYQHVGNRIEPCCLETEFVSHEIECRPWVRLESSKRRTGIASIARGPCPTSAAEADEWHRRSIAAFTTEAPKLGIGPVSPERKQELLDRAVSRLTGTDHTSSMINGFLQQHPDFSPGHLGNLDASDKTRQVREAISQVAGSDAKAKLDGFLQNLTAGAWEVPALAAIMGPKLGHSEVGTDHRIHKPYAGHRSSTARRRRRSHVPDLLTDGSKTASRNQRSGVGDRASIDFGQDNPFTGWVIAGVCLTFFLCTCLCVVGYKKLAKKDASAREASLLSGAELTDLAPGFQ